MAGHDGPPGAVYNAKALHKTAAHDAEMAKAGDRHTLIGLALRAPDLPRGAVAPRVS